MFREASVPAQLYSGVDARFCSPYEDVDSTVAASRSRYQSFSVVAAPTPICEPSPPCPVSSSSSSSSNKRSSSKKRKEFFEKSQESGGHQGNNEFPVEEASTLASTQETQLGGDTMVSESSRHRRSKNAANHSSVAFHHGEGISKKDNSKPQMERRRRKRINDSVEKLRKNIPELFSLDRSRYEKLEKAEILEMTAKYIQYMTSKSANIDWNEAAGEQLGSKELPKDNQPFIKIGKSGFVGQEVDKSDRLEVNGSADVKYNNTINKQQVTLIIHTASPPILQPVCNAPSEQNLIGFQTNSLGAQPLAPQILPSTNNQTPMFQLHITNNITNPPELYQTNVPSSDKIYISPISPDTTIRDFYHEPLTTFYDDKLKHDDLANKNIKIIYPDRNHMILGTNCVPKLHSQYPSPIRVDPFLPNNVTPRRPIAPKPFKNVNDCVIPENIPRINPKSLEEQDTVWRPWDAKRKILKPHIVQ